MKKIIFPFLLCFIISQNIYSKDHAGGFHSEYPNKVYSQEPAVSFDSKHLALTGDNKVRIWNIEGKQTGTFIDPGPYINPPNREKFWNPKRDINAVTFLPDNRHLAVSVFQRTVNIIDLSGNIVKTIDVKRKKVGPASGGWSKITGIVYFPDGRKIITIEPSENDIVLRDSSYNMLKRIKYNNGTMGATFLKVRVSPDGKYFVVLTKESIPSKGGWNSNMKLYDRNGRFIRDIETDKPEKVNTAKGRFKKEVFKPLNFHFTSDGKYIVYMNQLWFTKSKDPLNRKYKNKYGREKPLKIKYKIRRTAIPSGKIKEAWVTDNEVTFKEILPEDGGSFLGLDTQNMYEIDSEGDIQKTIPHEKIEFQRRGRTYSRKFYSSDMVSMPDQNFIFANTSDPYRGIVVYKRDGTKKLILKQDRYIAKRIRLSPDGRYIFLELDRGKSGILFDTEKNSSHLVDESFFFDSKSRPMILKRSYSKERASYINSLTINGKKEDFTEDEHRLSAIIPLPDGRFADIYNGFTIFKHDGDAVRRYPKAGIGIDTAIHPELKFYVGGGPSSKLIKVGLYNLKGKLITKWYLGAFFSTYTLSPKGSLIAGGHDSTGYLQVWNNKGKLLKRYSDLHSTKIEGISITGNDRYIASLEYDGTVMVTDMTNDRKLKLTFLSDGRFMASDDSGRYDCSNGLEERITITNKGEVISGDRTSGLVWKFLNGN